MPLGVKLLERTANFGKCSLPTTKAAFVKIMARLLERIGAETYRKMMTMSSHTPPPSPCVDFVVVGEADCTGGLSFADISSSLLNHNPTRAQVRPVVMTSNNAKAQDFYLRHATGTLCSAALTSRDIAWMERTSGLKTGALFKAFKQATAAGAPTVGPSKPDLGCNNANQP